jgi:nucleoside permease NupC
VIIVRLLAALLGVALVLVLLFLWSRDRRYLRWAWRIFLCALAGILGLMVFYFVERLVSGP